MHSGSLWTTYELPFGLEIGGGVALRQRALHQRLQRPEGRRLWVVDATMAYDINEQLTLRLNGFNLFDKRYADQVGGGHFVPGPGRSVLATMAFRR